MNFIQEKTKLNLFRFLISFADFIAYDSRHEIFK